MSCSETVLVEGLHAGGCGGDRGHPGITQGPIAAARASSAECDHTSVSPGMSLDAVGVQGAWARVSTGTSVMRPSCSEPS